MKTQKNQGRSTRRIVRLPEAYYRESHIIDVDSRGVSLGNGSYAKPLTMANMAISAWHIIAGIFGIPVFLLCLCILISEFIRSFNELKSYWYEKRS